MVLIRHSGNTSKKDPVEVAQEGKITTRLVKGGATLYLLDGAPSQSKAVLWVGNGQRYITVFLYDGKEPPLKIFCFLKVFFASEVYLE